MTDLLKKYKEQRKQEQHDETFKEVKEFRESCYHNLLPSDFKTYLKFILKNQTELGITKIEVYWWKYKPFFSKPWKLIDYVLLEWKDGRATKLSCMNRKGITELHFTKEVRNDILKYKGTIHESKEDNK